MTGDPSLVLAAERRAAWRDSLLAAGLPPGQIVAGGFTADAGARATRQLLTGAEAPTAVFYSNDLMAIAGIGIARELGLRVPGDVSIIGFDDIPVAEHVNLSLTTIGQDFVAAVPRPPVCCLSVFAVNP